MPIQISELNITVAQNMQSTIQQLEQRVAQLERALQLNGGKVTLQSGTSTIVLSPVGIEISARDVTIKSSGRVSVKASGDVVMKGSKIVQN